MILALMRTSWLTASSYRVGMVVSLLGFAVSIVPMFFVANALQPVVEVSIANESDQYFSFLVVGIGTMSVVLAAMSALPGAIGGSISSGMFEALMSTAVPLPRLLAGMTAYSVAWSLFRALLLLAGAAAVGMKIFWVNLPLAAFVVLLLILVHLTVALVASASVLVFRTSGPLVSGTLAVSALLGGVYYSTAVIPSWLQDLSGCVPLTYGLRAVRQLLLTGASIREVTGDVLVLLGMTIVSLSLGCWLFILALRHSQRAGTLAQY
jgi:ABC-2 type transport system permease protein